MSLRILHVTNNMPAKGCGVAQNGLLQEQALRGLGHEVIHWESWPPTYLPEFAKDMDVVYVNFHALTTGHIQGQHLPKGPLKVAYIHELSPSWLQTGFPDIWHHLDMRITEEDVPGWDVYPMLLPIPDYRPRGPLWEEWDVDTRTVAVGHTGIRGDGLDRIIPACEKNGWRLSKSGERGWLSMEDEIERLSNCAVVVVQNHGAYAGMASGVATAIASRRPVVCNSGHMLRYIHKINEEEFGGTQIYRIEDVEEGVRTVLADIRRGVEKRPHALADRYSWTNQTKKLVAIWEDRLRNR